MNVVETAIGGALLVEASGRLDSGSCARLETALLEHIAGGARAVVLDITSVDYVSSAGLRSLIVAARAMEKAGGRLLLAGVREEVRRILEICDLLRVFPIHADAAVALASLG